MSWLISIQRLYRRTKRSLLYINLVLILIVFYAGQNFSSLKDRLLPAAVVGAFAILFESIFSLNDSINDKFIAGQYSNISQAIPDMVGLVKHGSKEHIVQIIAASGGTTINTVIPALIDEAKESLDITLLIVDPHKELPEHFPGHWTSEALVTKDRLKKLAAQHSSNVACSCFTYDYIPCVHGILIDGQHLFLGFFVWVKTGNEFELSGAQQHHVYYRRHPDHENLFSLFETWFNHAPRNQLEL